jgi:hypothetical protein
VEFISNEIELAVRGADLREACRATRGLAFGARRRRAERYKDLGKALRAKSLDAVELMRGWELAYRKECFYYGIGAFLNSIAMERRSTERPYLRTRAIELYSFTLMRCHQKSAKRLESVTFDCSST